jgi:hypothetical protein
MAGTVGIEPCPSWHLPSVFLGRGLRSKGTEGRRARLGIHRGKAGCTGRPCETAPLCRVVRRSGIGLVAEANSVARDRSRCASRGRPFARSRHRVRRNRSLRTPKTKRPGGVGLPGRSRCRGGRCRPTSRYGKGQRCGSNP